MGFDVSGKVCLVTGSNRGIGKVIVESLIAAGASKVYAGVRLLATAEPLVAELGDKVVPIAIDLNQIQTINAAAATATDVELVINNAGIYRAADLFSEQAIPALQEEINVNVFGLIAMAQAFAPVLKAQGGGAFVQLNSVVSVKAFPGSATYCASKAASYSITQALRDLLAEQGTQVVSVHPGPIATDMANHAGMAEMAEPPSLVADAILKALQSEEFHVWPDSFAQMIGTAYQSYAAEIVERNLMEG